MRMFIKEPDMTQEQILEYLKVTEKLLSKTATILSGRRKEANIIALPDLGIPSNIERILGGFYTGMCAMWDSDVPFVPIDATVNVCGTAVYKLKIILR